MCYIPLQQHSGGAAEALVGPGDTVEEGQLIGKAPREGAFQVHASVPGRVVDVKESPSIFGKSPTVIIEAEGSFGKTGGRGTVTDWHSASGPEIAAKAEDAGLTGLGTNSFPEDISGFISGSSKASALIINLIESEPYLTADSVLINTCPGEIIEAIGLAIRMFSAPGAVVVMEKGAGSAGTFRDMIKQSGLSSTVRVKLLNSLYPSGSPSHLIDRKSVV